MQRKGQQKEDMEVKVKEAAFYTRKFLLFSLESTYRFTCRHPFAASFVFSMFLLHSCYPFLFVFLVSSSPVLLCTALLLGILLCYGEPNIPEIEDDKLNGNVSSSKIESPLDDLFVKKDKSYTLDGLVDSSVGTKGRTFKVLATDGKVERVGGFLAVSSLVEEQNEIEEDYILEHRFVENEGVLMKEQSECHVRMSEVADVVTQGVEDLIVTINKPDLDEWLDSSLGSPWQPINIHDAASYSESDRAESSSPDASMTDILPMLNELHPLLDSKKSKSASNSDAELSQHHESDEDSVDHGDEHKIEQSDAINKVVTWTADDQKNVMDLGSSDLERNQRLESLIARRRARKNQIIIFEKDLIDFHSNDTTVDRLFRFHPQIPPISAPRRNPFDRHHESEESKEYPPSPGSAPSVLLRQQNPFNFPCDSEDGSKGLAGDNLCLPEFGVPSQRGLSFRRHESFASRSLFPSDVMHEKRGSSSTSRLKSCFVREMLCLERNEYVDLDTMSSPIDHAHPKELAEQEMYEDRDLAVSIQDTKTSMQVGQSYRDDLVDFEPELREDGHFVDPNACIVTEETRESIDAPGMFKKEIEGTVTVSLMLDGQKHELVEEKHELVEEKHELVEEKHDEWTLFTSSEENEKSFDLNLREALETREQITSFSEGTSESAHSSDAYASHLFCKTERVDNNQAAVPIYDNSPSGSGNFIANIYVPDNTPLSSGRGGPRSTSSCESHVHEHVLEGISHARAFEETMTSEVMEFEMVPGSKIKDLTSGSGEPVTFSTYINLLDEDVLTTKTASETGEIDFTENGSAGLYEDFGDLATSIKNDHSGISSREADLNETNFAFSVGLSPSDVEEKHQSLEKLEMQTSFGTLLEESRISNLKLGPILGENSDDFMIGEGQVSLFKTTITTSTGSQILEDPNVCTFNLQQKVTSLHSQYEEEEAGDDGSEKVVFLPEKDKPTKASNLVSTNDDVLQGELFDRIKFPNLYKLKSEYEFTSNDGIGDSQGSDMNEFQTNQGIILRNLYDFCTNPGNLDAEVREIQCFDEHLLSELDAVGDFQVEGLEPQQCLYMESQPVGQLDCTTEDFELSSADINDTSSNIPIPANTNNPHEIDLVLTQRKTTDSEFWSLGMAPVDDLELTVYKPKLNVLQAYSFEELYSTIKQNPPREFAKPPLSETIQENSVAEKPHVGLSRFDMSIQEIEAMPRHATLLTPEKCIEDISSNLIEDERDFGNLPSAPAYFQLNDNHSSVNGSKSEFTAVDACIYDPTEMQSLEIKFDHAETVIPSNSWLTSYTSLMDEAEVSLTESNRDLEIGETDSELLVVDAKTIDDIDSAFKHVSETILNNSFSPLVIPELNITHKVDNVVGAISHVVEKTSGLLFLEAKSVEDINSTFKEATKEGLATPVFRFSDPESSKTRADFEGMELSYPDAENLSEPFVLEAKSAEDTQFALKQATEGASTTTSLVEPNMIKANQDLEFLEAVSREKQDNSEILIPEEKPSGDIDSAFKQFDIEKVVTHSNVKLEDGETGPANAENDTILLALENNSVDVTSSFQQATNQVYDKSSLHQVHSMSLGSQVNTEAVDAFLEAQNDLELSVLDAKSAEASNLNSDLEYNIVECLTHPTSQDDPRYFHPGHDVVGKKSTSREDKPEVSALETKSFDHTQLDFQNAAADFFDHPTTILFEPENHPGQEVVDEKPPEVNSLEDLNLAFEQAAIGFLAMPTAKDDTDYDAVKESCLTADNNSELIVVEKSNLNMQSAFSGATAGVQEESSSLLADPMPLETIPDNKVEDNRCTEPENNSEILIIEAKSIDDINSAFKLASNVPSSQLLPDALSLDTEIASRSLPYEKKSVKLTNSSLKQACELGSSEPMLSIDPPALLVNQDEGFMEENSIDKNDSELLVLEEKSVKDIDSTLKQVTEEYLVRPVTLQDDFKAETLSELEQKVSEFFILDPKSISDSYVTVKQVVEEDNKKIASSQTEESSTAGINQEMEEHGYATTAVETSQRQHNAEVVYARETELVSDETVTGKDSSSEDQLNNKTVEEEIVSEDPSS